MNFWKKNKNTEDRIELLINELKNILKDDNDFSVVFICGNSDGGASLIQGNFKSLQQALLSTSHQDQDFSNLIKIVAGKLVNDSLPPHVKKAFDKLRNSSNPGSVVNLPEGGKGIAIDKSKIKDMTNEDIDKIIDDMIGQIGEDESEE